MCSPDPVLAACFRHYLPHIVVAGVATTKINQNFPLFIAKFSFKLQNWKLRKEVTFCFKYLDLYFWNTVPPFRNIDSDWSGLWMVYLSAVVLVLSCTRFAGFVSRGSLLGSSTINACTHTNSSGKLFPILLIPLLFPYIFSSILSSVVDSWHFGTDPDTTDLQIRLWIRILLFGQGLTRCQQKVRMFLKFFYLLLFGGILKSGFLDKKSKRSYKSV